MLLKIKRQVMSDSFVARWTCNECGTVALNSEMKGEVKCPHCGSKSLTPS